MNPNPSDKRTLVLMRHAKSDWGDEALSDHDRPLNPRGRRDAPRMAEWLSEIDLIPDLILSSSSERTRQTVELMTAQWQGQPAVSFCDALYLPTPDTMLKVAASDGCDAEVLMMVSHNPATAYLVSELADRAIEMPTAAIAVFEVMISDWSKLRRSTPANLTQFMRPKAL